MAKAMSTRPWHNVAFYPGGMEALTARLKGK
jgi:hypothetical protein